VRRFALIVFLLCFASIAQAHKLNIFTYVESGKIFVESYFSDGIVPKDAKVKVSDAEDKVILEGMVNEEGSYTFDIPDTPKVTIFVDAGLGHVVSATLEGGEMTSVNSAAGAAMAGDDTSPAVAGLEAQIRRAVAEANKPMARELSALKNKVYTSDIIGGIGFIVGFLGLYAFMKARKEGGK
jgi:nickel transport protein